MLFNNIRYIFILFLVKPCFFLSSAHIIINQKSASESQSSFSSKNNIHDVSNAVVCDDSDRCVRLKEFSIADNQSLSCFEYYLPINFSDRQLGFYPPVGGIIKSKQKRLESCRKIKR